MCWSLFIIYLHHLPNYFHLITLCCVSNSSMKGMPLKVHYLSLMTNIFKFCLKSFNVSNILNLTFYIILELILNRIACNTIFLRLLLKVGFLSCQSRIENLHLPLGMRQWLLHLAKQKLNFSNRNNSKQLKPSSIILYNVKLQLFNNEIFF